MKSNNKKHQQTTKSKKIILAVSANFIGLIILFSGAFAANAQENLSSPEMEVAGVRLNDEESGRAFLSKYSPRTGANGQPVYFFYNKYATEVLKLTGFSAKQPHLITSAEVYAIGKSYQEQHYQINNVTSFATESGFFVGVRQSAKSLIFGVAEKTDTEKIVKLKGKPDEINKNDKRETLIYKLNATKNPRYIAVYEFNKDKLKKFSISIRPADEL